MSIIDLLLAEAIAAGMVRHALREARPPPDNFYEIPPNEAVSNEVRLNGVNFLVVGMEESV